MTTRWTKREVGHELTTETRISNVTFVFDGADKLVRVVTPGDDRAQIEKELRAKVEAELREQIETEVKTSIREASKRANDLIAEARKLVLSREAREKLDAALLKIGELS